MLKFLKDILKKFAIPVAVGRKNPVAGGIVYWFQNTSKTWVILSFIVLGSFIILINAAIEWSNHNPTEAIIITSSIILLIMLSLFAIKNKKVSVFTLLLFGSVYLAYLYYTIPADKEIVEDAINKGGTAHKEEKKTIKENK